MIISKKMSPFFFIGFMLAAYLKLPTIAITLFAVMFVIIMLTPHNLNTVPATGQEDLDDDF